MSNTSIITISACKNELTLIAVNQEKTKSYHLLNVKSTGDYGVNITLNIKTGLYEGVITYDGTQEDINSACDTAVPEGEYTLFVVGYFWGGRGGSGTYAVNVNGQEYNNTFGGRKPEVGSPSCGEQDQVITFSVGGSSA